VSRTPCVFFRRLVLIFSAVFLFASGQAAALTLADLNDGEVFDSGNGQLTFTFDVGSIVLSGALNSNLANYEVVILGDGFEIVGPIGVADGNVGDIQIDYHVNGKSGALIEAAALYFNGAAFGLGSLANVVEDFFSGGGLVGDMLVAVSGGGISLKQDDADLSPGFAELAVRKDIQVISSAPAQMATISVIAQRFSVPEPGSVVLASAGVFGLLVLGRPRRHRITN